MLVHRHHKRIELQSIAEWQYSGESDYPEYVELMNRQDDEIVTTRRRSSRDLALADTFWD